jgi:hypothetical protein
MGPTGRFRLNGQASSDTGSTGASGLKTGLERAALLWHGKSLWCQHCFASRIAAPEAETAMAEIDPMITHTMPLPDINKGFELMHEGKSIRSVRFLLSASSSSITSA